MKILKSKRSFRGEFRRQLRYAITAGIGFTVAFAWRNAIFDSFQDIVARSLSVAPNHFLTETYTAVAITLVAVLCILITSRLLREK